MTDKRIHIRQSVDSDIAAITEIYRYEVLNGLASFEVAPPTALEMEKRRNNILQAGYPYLVATQANCVVGYAYAGPYRTRPAYKHTIENSVYVALEARGRGVGKQLLTELMDICDQGTWRTVIAIIGDAENAGSIELHKSLGFRQVGTLQDAGYKFDRWVDSVIMQKMLSL